MLVAFNRCNPTALPKQQSRWQERTNFSRAHQIGEEPFFVVVTKRGNRNGEYFRHLSGRKYVDSLQKVLDLKPGLGITFILVNINHEFKGYSVMGKTVFAGGVSGVGDIAGHPALERARRMGMEILAGYLAARRRIRVQNHR